MRASWRRGGTGGGWWRAGSGFAAIEERGEFAPYSLSEALSEALSDAPSDELSDALSRASSQSVDPPPLNRMPLSTLPAVKLFGFIAQLALMDLVEITKGRWSRAESSSFITKVVGCILGFWLLLGTDY